ncbi:acetyl-CoA decarbonylase/synthase complex subunit delta [Parasporobacterium paucivorans]|uniref:Acetyl-CoA decarbonylase/synthase delta subunit n=1 Tax=Parasporobacterium paucivorans DSM 15970 TaxID=1122934 RepID=A0A1M6A9A2_9FIRM|nr:acetyl-CoA decarbonylase/synthase complex subunit delta [Parasporobacterium paucivorans]SHI33038.1 acetyl-CoA decarbonylase/synthase delta subunit [Parasporobacterium paucivorans DSM 15970]
MAYKQTSQKFNAAINSVEIGTGNKTLALGGENVLPFYSFDGPILNPPRVGVEISDLGMNDKLAGMLNFYGDTQDVVELVKKASGMPGAEFICLVLDSADPDGENRSVEDCVAMVKSVEEAATLPLMVMGCGNTEKDTVLFEKISEALEGKNIVILSAKEENYKNVGASAGLAYGQKVGAESSVDINLAKQLNVLLTQLGVNNKNIIMNLGSATAGYGFEYVVSTMDRVKMAALGQNDTALQMPIVTPVSSETWSVKESLLEQEDMPEWGSRENRIIDMEVATAAACLAAGSNAVILRHPSTVEAISQMIKELI